MTSRSTHVHGCRCETCQDQYVRLRATAKAVAAHLATTDPGTRWQLLPACRIDDHTRRARLAAPDGQQLKFHQFDGRPDRIYVGGAVADELFRHQPHVAPAMSITLGQHRSAEALAREIRRRVLPTLAAWTVTVRQQAELDSHLMHALLSATDGTGKPIRPAYNYHGTTDDWFSVTAFRRHDNELSFAVGFKPGNHNYIRIETWVPRDHAEDLVRHLSGRARELNAVAEPAECTGDDCAGLGCEHDC